MQNFDEQLLMQNGYLDEFLERSMKIAKFELQFIRIFEGGAVSKVEYHLPIIKECKKVIDNIQYMVKQMKQYFLGVKLEPIFTVFSTIYRTFIHIVKILCQLYFYKFTKPESQADSQNIKSLMLITGKQDKQNEEIAELCEACLKNRKKYQAKKMQYLDFTIKEIEKKEKELQSQMEYMIEDLVEEKNKFNCFEANETQQLYEELHFTFVEITKKAESLYDNYLWIKNYSEKQQFTLKNSLQKFEKKMENQLEKDIINIVQKRIKSMTDKLYKIFLRHNQSNLQKQFFKQKMSSLSKIFQGEKQKKVKRKASTLKPTHKNSIIKKSTIIIQSNRSNFFDSQAIRRNEQSVQIIAAEKEKDNQNQIIKGLKEQNEKLKQQIKSLKMKIHDEEENLKKTHKEFDLKNREYCELEKSFKQKNYELERKKTEFIFKKQQKVRDSMEKETRLFQRIPSINVLSNRVVSKKSVNVQTQTEDLEIEMYSRKKIKSFKHLSMIKSMKNIDDDLLTKNHQRIAVDILKLINLKFKDKEKQKQSNSNNDFFEKEVVNSNKYPINKENTEKLTKLIEKLILTFCQNKKIGLLTKEQSLNQINQMSQQIEKKKTPKRKTEQKKIQNQKIKSTISSKTSQIKFKSAVSSDSKRKKTILKQFQSYPTVEKGIQTDQIRNISTVKKKTVRIMNPKLKNQQVQVNIELKIQIEPEKLQEKKKKSQKNQQDKVYLFEELDFGGIPLLNSTNSCINTKRVTHGNSRSKFKTCSTQFRNSLASEKQNRRSQQRLSKQIKNNKKKEQNINTKRQSQHSHSQQSQKIAQSPQKLLKMTKIQKMTKNKKMRNSKSFQKIAVEFFKQISKKVEKEQMNFIALEFNNILNNLQENNNNNSSIKREPLMKKNSSRFSKQFFQN